MIRKPPPAAPAPRPLELVDEHLRPAALALADATRGREQLAVLPLLALLGVPVPDVRQRLEVLYPTLHRAADRTKALRLAFELLGPAERPMSLGEQVLLEMARDD